MNNGWIKLHRRMRNWEWRDNPNVACLFLNLLLEVNHKPSRYRGHDIPAGSGVFGRRNVAKMTGLSEQMCRTALDKLKSTNEITIKTTNKFSIISITNWEKYQGDNQQPNQQLTNNQPTTNQQVTTSKEGKKVRREEKSKTPAYGMASFKSDLMSIMNEKIAQSVIAHRKAKRAPFTKRSAELLIKGLKECDDIAVAVDMMIERNWTTVKREWVKNAGGKANGSIDETIERIRSDMARGRDARSEGDADEPAWPTVAG